MDGVYEHNGLLLACLLFFLLTTRQYIASVDVVTLKTGSFFFFDNDMEFPWHLLPLGFRSTSTGN
jgi:hypothetical protein